MANIDTGDGGGRKGQPKRMNLRVDFTPMVDMNMLLITFFMFCTTLSKPQTMNLVMPVKDKQVEKDADRNEAPESKTITVYLGADDKIYYYLGKPDMATNMLKETTFDANGFRSILLERNRPLVQEMTQLRNAKAKGEISEKEFNEKSAKIKGSDDGQIVIIKPTNDSSYKNLVDMLDEMQICSVGKYAIVEFNQDDQRFLNAYLGVSPTQSATNTSQN